MALGWLALGWLVFGVPLLVLLTACPGSRPEQPDGASHPGRSDAFGPVASPDGAEPSPTPGSSAAPDSGVDTAAPPEAVLPSKPKIYIQPLGKALPDEHAAFVRTSLLAFYEVDVVLLDRIAMPDWTLNRPKTRHRAEKLLDLLEQHAPDDAFRILGLTGEDISTTKGKFPDWGILGLATIDGKVCVISSFRTRRKARNAAHARVRLGKTAVHEIGHTLGLPHCPNRGCLMEDARGTVLTTDREYDLCTQCRTQLVQRGHRLAASEIPIPWDRPE